MNTNITASHPSSHADRLAPFRPADSLSCSRLRDACQAQSDLLTPLLNAFLVVCALVALGICGWQVGDWQHTQTDTPRPAVAAEKFSVSSQHVF